MGPQCGKLHPISVSSNQRRRSLCHQEDEVSAAAAAAAAATAAAAELEIVRRRFGGGGGGFPAGCNAFDSSSSKAFSCPVIWPQIIGCRLKENTRLHDITRNELRATVCREFGRVFFFLVLFFTFVSRMLQQARCGKRNLAAQ